MPPSAPTELAETLGGLPVRRLAVLWGILTLALVLRLVGLDWGLPAPLP